YNGAAQVPCSATVSGAGSLSETLTVTYTENTNAGTAHATATFAGDANHTGSTDTKDFAIAKAAVTATAGSGSATFDGAAKSPAACAVTGAYKGDVSCVNAPASVGPAAGTTATVPTVSGTGLENFDVTKVDGSYTISKATSAVTLTCPTGVTYNGAAQVPCSATVN